MIYSNKSIQKTETSMEWGTLVSFNIGERGRGRREISLPTNIKSDISKGLNPDITIGTTKTGRPRINRNVDNELYMIMSSEGGYTRRGNGSVQIPKTHANEISILAVGNGADGDAGRIGRWDCNVMKVPVDRDIAIRVKPGGGSSYPSIYYIVHEGEVYSGEGREILDACDHLEIKCPFPLHMDKNGDYVTDDRYWINGDTVKEAKTFQNQTEQITDAINEFPEIREYLDIDMLPGAAKESILTQEINKVSASEFLSDTRTKDINELCNKHIDEIAKFPVIQEAICKFCVKMANTNNRTFYGQELKELYPGIVKAANLIPQAMIVKAIDICETGDSRYLTSQWFLEALKNPGFDIQKRYIVNSKTGNIDNIAKPLTKCEAFLEWFDKQPQETKEIYYDGCNRLISHMDFDEGRLKQEIQKNPLLLAHIKVPSRDLVETAVSEPSCSESIFTYIKDPDPELQLMGVMNDSYVYYSGVPNSYAVDRSHMKAIKNLCPQAREWIAKNEPGYAIYIDDISPEHAIMAIDSAARQNNMSLKSFLVNRFCQKSEDLVLAITRSGYIENIQENIPTKELTENYSLETIRELIATGYEMTKSQIENLSDRIGIDKIDRDMLEKLLIDNPEKIKEALDKGIMDKKIAKTVLTQCAKFSLSDVLNQFKENGGEKLLTADMVLGAILDRGEAGKQIRSNFNEAVSYTHYNNEEEKAMLDAIAKHICDEYPPAAARFRYDRFVSKDGIPGLPQSTIKAIVDALEEQRADLDIKKALDNHMPPEMFNMITERPDINLCYTFEACGWNMYGGNEDIGYVIDRAGNTVEPNETFNRTSTWEKVSPDAVAIKFHRETAYGKQSSMESFWIPPVLTDAQADKISELQTDMEQKYEGNLTPDRWTDAIKDVPVEHFFDAERYRTSRDKNVEEYIARQETSSPTKEGCKIKETGIAGRD